MLTLKNTLSKALLSSVGRKYVMAVSGALLLGFMVTHLAANLLLFLPDSGPFNAYPAKLKALLGPLLIGAEVGLGILFLVHAAFAISLKIRANRARPQAYSGSGTRHVRTKGGNSKSNPASLYMIVSGVVLLVFLIIHIWQFRFGPAEAQGYIHMMPDGTVARDLYRLVVETFQDPLWVGLYCVCMLLFGLHLRHGFWSFFQSLGLMHPKIDKPIYCLGLIVATVMAAGFFFIPIWIYFDLYTKIFGS